MPENDALFRISELTGICSVSSAISRVPDKLGLHSANGRKVILDTVFRFEFGAHELITVPCRLAPDPSAAMPDDVDVAQYYNLPTAYPEEWPAQLDDGDAPETVPDDAAARKKQLKQQRKSARYSALGLATSRNLASAPFRAGAGDHASGKDEPDPLGSSDSVLHMLRQRGLPVDEDPQLRGRYMLSSTNFSPALFLSHAHSSASTQSLMEGLEFLSRSIDQKSASLKVLVESNFERFVRAKATIDSVYTEMRNQQTDKRFSHTRRISGHYRFSLQGAPPPPPPPVPSRKTALTKETEYGVQGIREPLVEASLKAEELWGPALSGREREQGLYAVLAAIEKNRAVYEIGGNLARAIKQRDYDSIFEAYRQARTLANEAKNITDRAVTEQRQLTDDESHTILVTGRMWIDVQQQVEAFKRELWRRLNNVHTSSQQHVTAASPVEEHMELICALLELGVEDNPVWIWLLSRYDLIKTRIKSFCERARAEIEILRRRLDAGDKPSPQVTTSFLRLSPRDATEPRDPMDTDAVLELWECIHTFLTKLLSTQNGLLGEVVDFWENAQSFIDGNKQKLLPAGFEGESRRHHRLSSDGVRQLRDGVVDLIELIRSAVLSLFADPPPEDVSALAAPPPANPATPMGHLTPTESRFKLDPKNVPPPTAGRGDPWEGFAFWPPYSNSLSGVHYLSKFLIIIGTAASEMSALSPVASSGGMHDQLKNLVSIARERSVRIACSAWNKDAENCKLLEDWTRDPERRELTKMPGFFVAFESAVLADMQKILYISEAMSKPGSKEVVTPPPAKLLQMVRSQFVTSVYKALSGLVENAERPLKTDEDDEWSTVGPRPTVPMRSVDAAMTIVTRDNIDAKNRVSCGLVYHWLPL